MNNAGAYWLWYPGDLERYHAMKQNFSRVERGCPWPAFWKSDGFRQRVVFRRTYQLAEETECTVYGNPGTVGHVVAGERKVPFGTPFTCGPGEVRLSIHAACIACTPAVYVAGDVIRSDGGWMVEDYCTPPVEAARNRYFTEPDQDVAVWPMVEECFLPVSAEAVNGGALYGFETELTAQVEVIPAESGRPLPLVYLGESRQEALDTEACYFFCRPDPATRRCPRQAVRWVFLPGFSPEEAAVRAWHQRVDIPVKAAFDCGDPELNRIFAVAAHTFSLCCDVFFLDGVKRDKWIWGGDAYQSLFVNRYLTGDRDIEERTLIALRGNDPPLTHVNTIVDYSLLWILSLDVHADTFGDEAFLRRMWRQAVSLMELLLSQRDGDGFLRGRPGDWEFVDWADFDREGPLCAEQMLLAAALDAMARRAPDQAEAVRYAEMKQALMEAVEQRFWDEEQGAYVDSFVSGRRHVTRHAAILAIVFDLVEGPRKQLLAERVLLNPEVPAITTPYFRFFELDALCRLGHLREVLAEIQAYWGGMLRLGAATFWEEYNPALPPEAQYAMYGDPYGKSLCHAWAASPIYLLARYFIGLERDPAAPSGLSVHPAPGFFSRLDCTLAYGEKTVEITIRDGETSVHVAQNGPERSKQS